MVHLFLLAVCAVVFLVWPVANCFKRFSWIALTNAQSTSSVELGKWDKCKLYSRPKGGVNVS